MTDQQQQQFSIWRAMKPAQRLAEASRMTSVRMSKWNAVLRRLFPLATEEELRVIRSAHVLRRCEREKAQRDAWFERDVLSAL